VLAGFPLLAAGVGVIGSAIGLATSTRESTTTALPAEGALSVWRAPLIFVGALFVLVVAGEIMLKLV
jgi:hypothetical protein